MFPVDLTQLEEKDVMPKLLNAIMIGAALVLPVTAYASQLPFSTASLTCGRAMIYIGDPVLGNPVVETDVGYTSDSVGSGSGQWSVLHTLRDGTAIDRSIQYVMVDQSNDDKTQWSGPLMSRNNVFMVGEIRFITASGQPTYEEWVYDHGVMTMHSEALCHAKEASQPAPSSDGPSS
jgi:hypothetical protein